MNGFMDAYNSIYNPQSVGSPSTSGGGGFSLAGLLDKGINYANDNAQGIGAITQGLGGLAGAYLNYNASQNAQDLANKQFSLAQSTQANELARRDEAQSAFNTGFGNSSLASLVDKKKQVGGLASTLTA